MLVYWIDKVQVKSDHPLTAEEEGFIRKLIKEYRAKKTRVEDLHRHNRNNWSFRHGK